MKVTEVVGAAKDAITVKRVYAEPYTADGLTIIPAAVVAGGAGGGSGHDGNGQEGEGGGLGVRGRPVGAYVIKDGQVSWRPALDVSRIVAVLGAVAVSYLLSRPRLARAKAKAKAKSAGRRRTVSP